MQIFAQTKYENPIEIIKSFDNKSFIEAFVRLEELRKNTDIILVGYVRYEAKEVFSGRNIYSELPLLYFEAFLKANGKMQMAKEETVTKFSPFIIPQIDYGTYKNAIEQIKEEIASGNTYQVNYTYDNKIETKLKGFELYNQILPNQTTPYTAYIKNEYEEILCFSPELFFELDGNKIRTKPMKGTVKRGETQEEDTNNIEFLKNDIKNKAENVMIVDLLRNDLGKIAKTATVKVDKLFEVETHKTVHQMTSEISAELQDDTTLFEIFEAIFPCGSVTGAPKINTMEIIETLEEGKRGVYCGAIGVISRDYTVFNVPIRTLQKKNIEDFYTCRVGGAVVWDSTPEEEWEETITKIKFLSSDEFKLVETMLVESGEIKYLKEHIERLEQSAKILGFNFSSPKIEVPRENCLLRLLLSKNGEIQAQILPFEEIKTNKVIISNAPINSAESLLYHKTTNRVWYKESMEKRKRGEIFDEIFFNERGELAEGARSNVVLQLKGKLYTPPVECGLLNGIMRQKLIAERKLVEKKLYLDDLKRAEKVFCVNSVRGIVEVEVEY